MQPEQQQRIMGYFIEEAKDHLNTIEQGLLNLQNTIADPEMVNEVFRAAHSVKGGAAMLGLSSIQKTSHRLEDFFKILKETPGIKPDQTVETLLLRVFDTLQELLEQLQGPFGLTEETSNATMANVEPVFEELQQYLNLLERQGTATIAAKVASGEPAIVAPPSTVSPDSALVLIFQNDVPAQLREMLQLFRQAETLLDGRDRLQAICAGLRGLGEAFDLDRWCNLVNTASQAIADPNNAYRALAPIVIRDFKQAQELVLAGRVAEVAPSATLIALVPLGAAPLAAADDLADFFAMTDILDADDELDLSELDLAAETNSLADLGLDDLGLDDLGLDTALFESGTDDPLAETAESSGLGDRNGPEVGMAELNSLADLFEGEMPDLGATWQREEVIGSAQSPAFDLTGEEADDSGDFSDLLFDDLATPAITDPSDDDDLTSLFGDDLLEELSMPDGSADRLAEIPPLVDIASDDEDFDLFDLSTSEELSPSSDGDIFDDLSLETLGDLNLASGPEDFSSATASRPAAETPPPDDLGDLFTELDDDDFSFDGLDSLLDADPTPAASISDPWESLEKPGSPLNLTLESAPQNELDSLTDDPFGDLADLDFGLPEEPATSLDSSESLSLETSDQETADLSLTGDFWTLSEAGAETELPLNLGDELETPSFGFDSLTATEESLGFSNSLFADAASDDDPTELDLTLASRELPYSLEVSDDDDLLAGLLTNEASEETLLDGLELDGLELDGLELASAFNREPEPLDDGLDLTDLEDDFFGLSGGEAADLSDRPAASPVESFFALNLEADSESDPFALNLEADLESEPADLAGLFGSDSALGFSLDHPQESSDLNFNTTLETNDELGSLFDASSEDLGLLFADEPNLGLEATDSLGFPMAAEPSEEPIAEASAAPAQDRFDFDLPSNDLDDLLNLDLTAEETSLDFDGPSTDDRSESLDDPLGLGLIEAADPLGFDLLLEDDPSETQLFDSALGFDESEGSELPDNLDPIAEPDLFRLDSDELVLESPDSLSDVEFDLFSEEPETASLAADSSDSLFGDLDSDLGIDLDSDLDLDLSQTADFDLESLDGFEPSESDAAASEAADDSGFSSLLGVGIAAASVAALGAAITATHRPDESHETEAELDDLFGSETSEPEASLETDLEFGDLDDFLSDDLDLSAPSDTENFDDLDGLFGEAVTDSLAEAASLDQLLDQPSAQSDEFDDLNALLSDQGLSSLEQSAAAENFDDLESLLSDAPEPLAPPSQIEFSAYVSDSDMEFDDLEKMLEDADKTMGGSPSAKGLSTAQAGRRINRPGKGLSEQTMRVPVKHLDNLSNLVGELVVNRNSLEQDQERLRQSLDNLLYQVQQLSDVGQRMQDLYERSLLESSLLASRSQRTSSIFGTPMRSAITPNNPSEVEYDPLEMDRFTGFHSLSQEMIELIVRVRESASDIGFIVDETDQVTRMFRQVTTQLQEGLTRSRMVPFAQTADRLPRAVRDIAMKCGKQAELVIEGRDTLIDKMILEHLYDPMTHLVNNAITHGIETPDVRRAAGKSPIGQITIRAFHQGNQTVISVSDDGAGVDIERVKVKAIEKGLITSAESKSMARLDIYDLLFHPGFTTKDQADDFSGRGVGMDVVRTSLNEIRGVINTDSAMSKGTTFTVRLPLTLSISKALCCVSDRARVAFPMDGVEDMLDIPKERIQTDAEGNPAIAWRDSVLTLRPLTELLGYNRHLSRGNVYGGNQEDDMVSVVVLRSAGNYLALQVDQVLGEQEIVIKQLEGPVPKPVGVAGATVLGDGRIMPIADVLELIDLSMGRIRRDVGTMWDQGAAQSNDTIAVKTEPTVLIVDDSITVRELLSMTFNKVGYRVEQARDGQEAWEKLRAGLPCDIVFCDIEMPRMDGLELLSRIQKDPNLSSLPIAMLTSRGADRHRQMAASLGASGYFTKPYLEEALLDAAQRMLKGEILIVNNRDQ